MICRPGRASASMAAVLALGSATARAVEERGVDLTSATGTTHHQSAIGLFQREQWSLSEAEWARYLSLMQGIRGSVSPATLSPLEVLGIHARDDKERRDYAQRWATLMQQDAERILAFQRAYAEAFARIAPPLLIDTGNLPASPRADAPGALQRGDRLLLFVRLAECPACEARLAEALRASRQAGAVLDIFVSNAADDGAIRAWAARQRIDPAVVKDRRVTLNHDRGELTRIGGLAATVPLAARWRNGSVALLGAL